MQPTVRLRRDRRFRRTADGRDTPRETFPGGSEVLRSLVTAVSPRLGGKHREEPAVAGSSERVATASRAVGVRGAGWALGQRVRVRAGARPGKRPQQSRGWRGPGETGTPALAVRASDGVAVAVAWGPGPQEKLRTERPRGRQPHSGVCPRTRNRSLRARSAPRVHHCAATAQTPAAAGGTRTQDVRATEYYSALKKVA